MKTDLKKANIVSNEDWEELKNEWISYFEDTVWLDWFEHIKGQLSKLNIVVGFGRGFWSGVDTYYYIVYHKEKNKFYWYVRNEESDEDVYFYEIDEDAQILKLLKEKSISENFFEYDKELEGYLYDLSVGKKDKKSKFPKETSLMELFGEDSEPLRFALMYFKPATVGSKYPHKEFEQKYLKPTFEQSLDQKAEALNKVHKKKVFCKGKQLYVDFDGEIFKLMK